MNDETAQEFGVCARAKGRREAQRAINRRDRRKKQAPVHARRVEDELQDTRAALNAELRAAFKEDPSSLSADDRARAEQLLARDARKAAKKAARRVSSESA